MKLREIAKRMKLEAYNIGVSKRMLGRGLKLTLTPFLEGWKLMLEQDNTTPSKMEYRVVAKAFFDGRVKHISQPAENSIEIITVEVGKR